MSQISRILGLDLGSSSIGWSVIDYGYNPELMSIIDLGSRVIPIDGETLSKFNTGQAIEMNAKRTARRTARKMLDRYQQRRTNLRKYLNDIGICEDESLVNIDRLSLWRLRADAVDKQIGLSELHRVLLHINQKRGYNASKADFDNEKDKGYVAEVRKRYNALQNTGLTVGQFHYNQLIQNPEYSVKGTEQVLPRAAYFEETKRILDKQAEFYPNILTQEVIDHILDYVMFYQRPLKSCKHLVGECEHMSREIVTPDGKKIIVAPKVAHKSNPLFEESRIWQAVNNITLRSKSVEKINEIFPISTEQRQRFYKHLQTKPTLKLTDIYAILFNKKKCNEWEASESLGKGIPGNRTIRRISEALGGKYGNLLQFEINTIDSVDKTTGNITKVVDPNVIEQPLYRLWHTLYSIPDIDALKNTLRENFNIDDEDVLENLVSIDFSKDGYGNMSVKAIRAILPHLMNGEKYSDACDLAGFRHSDYLTTEENQQRELAEHLKPLKKGELRQPIVEKILNQTVNLVNELIDSYGPFDEIHIELARELQQSREQRNETTKNINKNEKENKALAERLQKEYNLTPTRTRITKLKLWQESRHRCMYCDTPVNISEFLEGLNYETEHIIPKSIFFDDSFSNKVCACRKCNHEKNNMTAYDYMQSKGERKLGEYIARINELKNEKIISERKFRYLTMTADEIPDDFIDRQLRQSQYIARKAMEMMQTICRNVVATSGSVTAFLRHAWGYNNVLHDINYPRYARNEQLVDSENNRIIGWDKRADHRHHAIDALVIACTNRSIINRLNHMSSLENEQLPPFLGKTHAERQSRLERYALSLPHFSFDKVLDTASGILVSIKPITKLTTPGKRYIRHGGKAEVAQTGIRTPRGPLHEETIHGAIYRYDEKGRLVRETVVKKPITSITSEKDAAKIVDSHIKQLVYERLNSVSDKKNAFAEPLYSDAEGTKQIKSVRMFTGLTRPITLRTNDDNKPIAFVKPGSNHHLAIYEDEKGKLQVHVTTFMHAVDRSNKHIPVIITNPQEVWSEILEAKGSYSEEFLNLLPTDGWKFRISLQRNEMFVLGLDNHEFERAIKENDHITLCNHLYRVQKISKGQYAFALHTQTYVDPNEYNKSDNRFLLISSPKSLLDLNPKKVSISISGKISKK